MENPYVSPEVTEMVETDAVVKYRRSLTAMAQGVMCVMLSFVVAITCMIVGNLVEMWLRLEIINGANVVGLSLFCGLQFIGAMYCYSAADVFAENGKLLIFSCGILFVSAILLRYFTVHPLSSDVWSFVAMLLFGCSCWCWQVFLLRLARRTESRWLTLAARLVLLTFTIAGFATMSFFAIASQPGFPLPVGVALFSGFAYFGLYAVLLIGLWKRLWMLVVRSQEGVADVGE